MRLMLAPRLGSPARAKEPERGLFRIGAIQHRWHPDPEEHHAALADAVRLAGDNGAQLICLPELTLSSYFPARANQGAGDGRAESIPNGSTCSLASELARETGAYVQASLYERCPDEVGLGFNTAVVFAPTGGLAGRTRKLHIPVTAGYHEDTYFRPGPASDAFPVVDIDGVRVGFPTCWDQWFPEVARAYSIASADVLVFPTAIGSEPDHPEFDTEPLWEQVIIANGIANGLFMVAINRVGDEEPLSFYGSSFISDPYGRKLVQAPRDNPAVLVADVELDHRRDWLELFPFLETRRPDAYGPLTGAAATRFREW